MSELHHPPSSVPNPFVDLPYLLFQGGVLPFWLVGVICHMISLKKICLLLLNLIVFLNHYLVQTAREEG
jgi:hypothetical protein